MKKTVITLSLLLIMGFTDSCIKENNNPINLNNPTEVNIEIIQNIELSNKITALFNQNNVPS